MSTPATSEPVRIQLQSRADGSTDGLPAGWYLASYDADGNDGWGQAVWTDDPAEAIEFAAATDARTCWMEQSRLRPLRPDGQPNRPLTDPWARHDPLVSMEPESDMIDRHPEPTDAEILQALGLTPDAAELSDHAQRTADAARQAQARLDELVTLPQPEQEDQIAPTGACGPHAARQREALTQPARPLVRPAEGLADVEAGR